MIVFAIGAAVGGAAIWFGKDTVTKWVVGVESFIKSLEAKAAALKAKL